MQLKQYEIVQNKDLLSVDIQEVCMKYKTIKKFAYILHDKDDTRPHYHIYVNFGNNGVSHELVASWFNVPPNFVSKVKGRTSDVLLYLIHGNESQKHKHQYDPSEVVSNFAFETEINNSKIIGNFKDYSFAQMLKYIDTLPISEKCKAHAQLERLWRIECAMLTFNADRNIDVVFICGKAGTGKTYYAKKLLSSMGYDYCVSSSSNDPYQDYLGQRAIILDDMRDTVFDLPDLLKILDNNTGSSVRSRFTNKVFNGKMIILTSSVPLNYWYKMYRYNAVDTLDQLYRRINTYVEVKEKEILVYDEIDNYGKPKGEPKRYHNEVFDLKKSSPPKRSIISEFDKICTPIQEVTIGNHSYVETFDFDDVLFGDKNNRPE